MTIAQKTRDCAVLVAATAVTRWAFRSHFLYDVDSVNFALAMGRFDPSVHQPQPPGYFLYVRLGMLANAFFHDPNSALVAISILASCGTVAMVYLLACSWFGRTAANFAGLIFIVSPLAWFHGTVALTYIVEAQFSALTGYFCWRVCRGEARFIVAATLTLGLAAGFRQSSLVVLLPLVLWSIRGIPARWAIAGLAVLPLTLAAWLVPMLRQAGGWSAYASSLWALWTTVPSRQTLLTSPIFMSLARAGVIVAIFVLCFGAAAPLIIGAWRRWSRNRAQRIFTIFWLTPALLLFTLVFLKFVNSGYLLVLLPPACIWMGAGAADWYEAFAPRPVIRSVVIAAAAVVNTLIFLRAPVYCSYAEVRRSERELVSRVVWLRQIARPEQTLIVGFDSHFLGYRHAGYYLPEYWTVQYPEIPLASATGVFIMQHRDTRLVSRVPIGSLTDFILFPLPSSGREYQEYMSGIRAHFISNDIRATTYEGVEFLRGPIDRLSVLLPNAAAAP